MLHRTGPNNSKWFLESWMEFHRNHFVHAAVSIYRIIITCLNPTLHLHSEDCIEDYPTLHLHSEDCIVDYPTLHLHSEDCIEDYSIPG